MRVRGVVLSAPRLACRGVFLGVLLGVLRAEGVGGGMASESALPLLPSMLFTERAGDLNDFTDPGVVIFFGDMLILFAVGSSCGTFSLSSMKSVKSINEALSGEYASCGTATFSSIASNAMSPREGLCCLLGLLLAPSMTLWKGEEGGPSTLKALSSIGLLMCMDGDSIVWCAVVCVSCRGRVRACAPARDRLYVFDRLFQNRCFGGDRLVPA